ncbi:MAG: hypothetical protein ABI432_17820 [Flavobacteriales bacterium]
MSQDKHFNPTDQHLPHALEDHKGTDMPAARSIGWIIIGLLVLFAVITAVLYKKAEAEYPDPTPQEQPR